ncbi:Alpha-mannosidase 2C1 [Gonapodya sp. JEL0774]|nr:Alpha-mannosidase 2C1 [Gonapodya sp. JEL0774]
MVWTEDGTPIKGLTGGTWVDRRAEYVITKNAKGGEINTFYIELACNGMFGVGRNGMINPTDPDRYFDLAQAELKVPNMEAWALFRDFEIVLGMAKELPADSDRGSKALVAANDIVNAFRYDDASTIQTCRALAARFLAARNGDAVHKITAIGHCHIDTAWLWPYAETKRKVARSWAAQVELMDRYPDYKFAASQMQQENRFIPIGGTWVEMDCNGNYTGMLQLDLLFVFFNEFGLILTHFCPADTYCSQADVKDVNYSVKNHKDLANSSESLLLFGNGDGGGGPNDAMIERLLRMQDVAGLPKVEFGSPNEFYKRLESSSRDLSVWKGELFHDVLPGSSITQVYKDTESMYQEIRKAGVVVLDEVLAQLLEVLGTPQAETANTNRSVVVHNTTRWMRSEVVEVPIDAVSASLSDAFVQKSADGKIGLVYVPDIPSFGYRVIDLTRPHPIPSSVVVSTADDGTFFMENDFLTLSVDVRGRICSLVDKSTGRNAIASGGLGNVFKIYEDVPLFWDAWDVEIYHLEKGWDAVTGSVAISEKGPARAVLVARHPITTTSSLTQKIILTATSRMVEFETEVEWQENRRFLKVEFQFDIVSDFATYETAFGSLQRPTHANTSWDIAKFEVCGHKFADLSEFGFGCAILNDCKYGYATRDNTMRLSLIRSPKSPDDTCDMGHHTFRYAVYPHKGTFAESDVVKMGYQFNVQSVVKLSTSSPEIAQSFFQVESENVVLDTIKLAEDDLGAVIIRLYDAYGGRSRVTVKTILPLIGVAKTNGLEDEESHLEFYTDGGVACFSFDVQPFKIVTLKLSLPKRIPSPNPSDDWERIDYKL